MTQTKAVQLIKRYLPQVALVALAGVITYVLSLYAWLRQHPLYVSMRCVPQGGLPDGYTWELSEGPGFDVYYGQHFDNPSSGAGIYFGQFPSYHFPDDVSPEDLPRQPGRVGPYDVSWIEASWEENVAEYQFYRTTIQAVEKAGLKY